VGISFLLLTCWLRFFRNFLIKEPSSFVEKHENWQKPLGYGYFKKLKEHVVFMKEAAKNAFLGSFFHYFLWGAGGGGGGWQFTSELVLWFSENSGYVQSKNHGNRFCSNRGPCEAEKEKKRVFQRTECLLQQVFCFLNRLPNSGVKLCCLNTLHIH
jgi:hypothetical protein